MSAIDPGASGAIAWTDGDGKEGWKSMKERPILFSGAMVRAILEGRKTMTRRVVKLPDWFREEYSQYGASEIFGEIECPYGRLGDRLWVRETWATSKFMDKRSPSETENKGLPFWFCSDNAVMFTGATTGGPEFMGRCRWRPSIHMPRWASRLTLEVTAVRVERLQDISRRDAIAEGCVGSGFDDETPQAEFAELCDSVNAARGFGWDVNPWVWVIEFKRMEQEAAQ